MVDNFIDLIKHAACFVQVNFSSLLQQVCRKSAKSTLDGFPNRIFDILPRLSTKKCIEVDAPVYRTLEIWDVKFQLALITESLVYHVVSQQI